MSTDPGDSSRTGPDSQYLVDDLSSETIMAVAERVDAASRFEELVYRESEIDALWTLADIALTMAQHPARQDPGDIRVLTGLKGLITQAHDLVPDGEVHKAAAALRKAAALLASDPASGDSP